MKGIVAVLFFVGFAILFLNGCTQSACTADIWNACNPLNGEDKKVPSQCSGFSDDIEKLSSEGWLKSRGSFSSCPPDYPFYTISDLNQKRIGPGDYITEGYVLEKSINCPPCPKGFDCAPCFMGNYIIISEYESTTADTITYRELHIFDDNPERFKLGEEYRFYIKITDSNTLKRPVNDVELLGYNLK